MYFIMIYLFRYAKYKKPFFFKSYKSRLIYKLRFVPLEGKMIARHQLIVYCFTLFNNVAKVFIHSHPTENREALKIDYPAMLKHVSLSSDYFVLNY